MLYWSQLFMAISDRSPFIVQKRLESITKLKAACALTFFKQEKAFHILIASLNTVCIIERLVVQRCWGNRRFESSLIVPTGRQEQ